MVKRSEIGVLSVALRQTRGLSVESEALGVSSGVHRAASILQMQSDQPVVASRGATKTATLAMRWCCERSTRSSA